MSELSKGTFSVYRVSSDCSKKEVIRTVKLAAAKVGYVFQPDEFAVKKSDLLYVYSEDGNYWKFSNVLLSSEALRALGSVLWVDFFEHNWLAIQASAARERKKLWRDYCLASSGI